MPKKKTNPRIAWIRLGIDTHHPSGIGSLPRLHMEVQIPLDLDKQLYKDGKIHIDETNRMYCCWSEDFKHEWTKGGS